VDTFVRTYAATLVPSHGVQRIRHLHAFLAECERLVRSRTMRRGIDSVAGWGFKPTAARSRQMAHERGLPYIALEDGFFRSIGHGEAGAPPLSLVVDDVGIYYDARQPSRLEQLLATRGWETPELMATAARALKRVVDAGLAKTNVDPVLDERTLPPSTRRRILIVDQTANDASIEGALATRETFAEMLRAARRDEPDAEIVVRRHPVVSAGLRQGCLDDADLQGTTILAKPARTADVLARVDAVYTVSSLTGFEALLRDIPVRCFGMPFYAGWGVSRDELSCPRRGTVRSVPELFAAACLLYARYVDPLTGAPCDMETALDRLLLFRERSDANAGYTAAVGVPRHERPAIRRLLASPRGRIEFHPSLSAARIATTALGGRILLRSGGDAASVGGDGLVQISEGFLRYDALGGALPITSAVLDDMGAHHDPSRPSRLEAVLQRGEVTPELCDRARRLRLEIVQAGVFADPRSASIRLGKPQGQPRIVVLEDADGDASELVQAVRRANPTARLILKTAKASRGAGYPQSAGLVDQIMGAQEPVEADAIATGSSLAGLDALIRGMPVQTYGVPFYAGWGLTIDHLQSPRRTRRLSLDELIAGALISVPIYVDPKTGLPCPPEHLLATLSTRPRVSGTIAAALRGWLARLRGVERISY
jgi:capsular polysaccharide export protein